MRTLKIAVTLIVILASSLGAYSQRFSTLDPLGSQYGGINRPTLDQKSFEPFEGAEPLGLPEINFPESKTTSRKKKHVAEKKEKSAREFANELMERSEKAAKETQDNNEYVRLQSYDANNLTAKNTNSSNLENANTGMSSERFINSPCFHEIGFHPFMDINGLDDLYRECEWKKTKHNLFIGVFILAGLALLTVLYRLATKK